MKIIINAAAVIAFLLTSAASIAQAGLDDAQIAGIVITANTVDIDAGKLAEAKSRNEEVRAFAKRMVTDHSAVNEQAAMLVKKLNVTPRESEISKALKENGTKALENLKTLEGKAFDKTYLDNEVAYHQAVLEALDKTLIPNAKNEELETLLVKVRPAFVVHLEHAKHMQSSLK